MVVDFPLLRSNGVKFLAKSIPRRRHLPYGIFRADSSMAWRGLPVKGVDGTMGVWDSFWSMLKVTPESDPGASWIPRELDVGADRLSNMDGSGLTRRSGSL